MRGAAQWWLEDPPARDEHPTVLLCAAMRAGAPEWLREHPDPLVSTMAGLAPERALAWLLPPDDFPFDVETWFATLLRQTPRPVPALEQRVAAPCASEDAATLRDLAGEELLKRTFRAHARGPQLDDEQRRVVELIRRHGARVPWFEHGLPDL